MGLSSRKEKQKIGDDPRNTRWARNEANPGFKLLSSMGWNPASKSLGLSGEISSSATIWKKHPSAALPVIRSNTSGLGANPNTGPSYCGLGGSPRFVLSSMKENQSASSQPEVAEKEEDRKEKLAIVSGGNGGGFSDLLSRLNRSQANEKRFGDGVGEDFVIVELPNRGSESESNHEPNQIAKRERRLRKKKRKHQETAEEEDRPVPTHKPQEIDNSTGDEKLSSARAANGDHNAPEKARKRVRIVEDNISDIVEGEKLKRNRSSRKLRKEESKGKGNGQALGVVDTKSSVKSTEKSVDKKVVNAARLHISRPINPRMAARAKYIESKRLATSLNPTAMAEILGVPLT